jgi:predicted short-subunit dehydrogenase-like oxidoreductase (DUF2520 family)
MASYTAIVAYPDPGSPIIAIAGSGAVARALGCALREAGVDIAYVASRNPDHARTAAELIAAGTIPVRYCDIPSCASHVIIAVSDRAIPAVAEEIAATAGKVRIALHTSGTYGSEVLAPLAAAGVSCGTIHPLQTFRDSAPGVDAMRVAPFAVSGDQLALAWAEEIAGTLSGHVIHIGPEGRTLYHAAAVMASNYLVVLLDAAEQLMQSAGVPRGQALRVLAPLVRTTVENVFSSGTVQALTGPAVRGDSETVARHLSAMKESGETLMELYRSAGLGALDIARRRGLASTDRARVEQALVARE